MKTISSHPNLLVRLIERGDAISIKHGQLKIQPASGKATPPNWLSKCGPELVTQILELTAISGYQYQSYSTGEYSVNRAKRAGGITLIFTNMITHDESYLIFNVNLRRQRSTKHGKKGDPLPKDHFQISKRCSFYRFWVDTGLAIPTRLGAFSGYMGNLSTLIFTGETALDNKNKSRFVKGKGIAPLNITHEMIIKKLAYQGLAMDKPCTVDGQPMHNSWTSSMDKETSPSQVNRGLQPVLSTCAAKYDNKVKDNTIISYTDTTQNLVPIKAHHLLDQSAEEWLQDYNQTVAL